MQTILFSLFTVIHNDHVFQPLHASFNKVYIDFDTRCYQVHNPISSWHWCYMRCNIFLPHSLFFSFSLFFSSSFFPYFSPLLFILTSPYGWNQARGWNFPLGGSVVSWHGLASLYHPHQGPAVCLLDDRLGHRQGGGQHPLVYAILSSSWDINVSPLLWCL